MKKKLYQREKILHHLQRGKTITQKQAINKFGCYRLSARIAELRTMGYNIVTEIEKNKGEDGYHAKYRLEEHNV